MPMILSRWLRQAGTSNVHCGGLGSVWDKIQHLHVWGDDSLSWWRALKLKQRGLSFTATHSWLRESCECEIDRDWLVCSDAVVSTCHGEGGAEKRNPKAKLFRNHSMYVPTLTSPSKTWPGHSEVGLVWETLQTLEGRSLSASLGTLWDDWGQGSGSPTGHTVTLSLLKPL